MSLPLLSEATGADKIDATRCSASCDLDRVSATNDKELQLRNSTFEKQTKNHPERQINKSKSQANKHEVETVGAVLDPVAHESACVIADHHLMALASQLRDNQWKWQICFQHVVNL